MPFEKFSHSNEQNVVTETEKLSAGFRELSSASSVESGLFENLENDLTQENFLLATSARVFEVFNTQSLFCRSESFSKIMDLILVQNPLKIQHTENEPNMCIMASGNGFKVAMNEGFSGKDVNGMVKSVITFNGDNIHTQEKIGQNNKLWELKPETAQVSFSGSGEISFDDIAMVSFRFPVQYFPENLLSEEEKENLEESNIRFIVRHYIPNNKKTVH